MSLDSGDVIGGDRHLLLTSKASGRRLAFTTRVWPGSALKQKYPEKKVVIYPQRFGDRFMT